VLNNASATNEKEDNSFMKMLKDFAGIKNAKKPNIENLPIEPTLKREITKISNTKSYNEKVLNISETINILKYSELINMVF
jgi:hypothetical protein